MSNSNRQYRGEISLVDEEPELWGIAAKYFAVMVFRIVSKC
jgi:hypothetical protein